MFRNRVLQSLCLTVLLVVGACGGNAAADDVGLATLGSGDSAETTTTTAPQTEADFEEGALNFAQCMRDEGITDFPDPSFDGDRGISISRADERAIDFESDEVQAAFEACGSELGGAAGGPGLDSFDVAELQDNLLAMAGCLRDHGLDVDDPDLSNFGPAVGRPISPDDDSTGDEESDGEGASDEVAGGADVQMFAPFGDLDINDPKVQEAMETCEGELGGFGPRVGIFEEPGE